MTPTEKQEGGCLVAIVFFFAFLILACGIDDIQDSVDHLQETIEQQASP